MPPALKPAVPSRRLLRFLRAQSEGLAFAGCPSRLSTRRHVCVCARTGLSEGLLNAPVARREATLQAAFLGLDAILPKALTKQRAAAASTTKSQEPTPAGGAPRYASSRQTPGGNGSKPAWHEWLFGPDSKKGGEPLKEGDIRVRLEEESGSIFQRRSLTAKAAMDPRLRCTEVDGTGKVIMVDGELKKSELIARYGLLPRDLRKIDSSNLPHILVRPSAILLNLLHLKVLIKHDRVLLFDVYGSTSSYPQSAFMYDLQGKLQQKQVAGANSLPYEFRALEAVLMSVTSELEADFESVRDPVIRILSDLEDDIDREKLRILLVLSKRVSTFEQKARLVRDAIEELLEADDDLADMYLTEKMHDLIRGEDDHTEVELLLESYNKICDEVVQEAGNLVSSIRNTEEIIRAILDANRNSLMLLDLKFSVGTLGLAMGTFLAGLYGMNLENFIEETNWGFGAVTGLSSIFSLIVCWYGLVKLRKVGRVKMNGGGLGGLRSQDHWFCEDGTDALLDPSNRERLRRINMMKNAKQARAKKWPFR
ncbi:uncharacterized protein B0H64DRAFT_71168 [Chaetomium fimeti]|uniref:Magnesium transporter n=1 Tax=Chaetomium fimeti TaxID=1854472 RepID=A0AAE0LVE9_9PEZI|nr:hypothetical protein B0H64DRAFT_71168 [Chaetomium fimeti]